MRFIYQIEKSGSSESLAYPKQECDATVSKHHAMSRLCEFPKIMAQVALGHAELLD